MVDILCVICFLVAYKWLIYLNVSLMDGGKFWLFDVLFPVDGCITLLFFVACSVLIPGYPLMHLGCSQALYVY